MHRYNCIRSPACPDAGDGGSSPCARMAEEQARADAKKAGYLINHDLSLSLYIYIYIYIHTHTRILIHVNVSFISTHVKVILRMASRSFESDILNVSTC